ncbi:MAG: superoxide dismutase family protein [Acidimicrobiia bacterium]
MRTTTPRTILGVAAVTGTLAVAGLTGPALAGGSATRSTGPDVQHVAGAFDDADAAVQVVRTGTGGTRVSLHVWGVDAPAGTTFGAHVHNLPCGSDPLASGGHYAHPAPAPSLEARELWLDITVNEAGNGQRGAVRSWTVDESSPRSVVIHAQPTNPVTGAAGARLACIDLDGE